MRKLIIVLAIQIAFCGNVVTAADGEKPPKPPKSIPSLADSDVVTVCINCLSDFSIPKHKLIMNDMLNKSYQKEMHMALYNQDIVNQFKSEVHFDNCDFEGAISYIETQLSNIDNAVKQGNEALNNGSYLRANKAVIQAFFHIGQALHGIQDFYAHSNYVELQLSSMKAVEDIKVVPVWLDSGKEAVSNLRANGLVSGYVSWGKPQLCPNDTPSHAKMAKDTPKTNQGSKIVEKLGNVTQFEIAEQVASKASFEFLKYAFNRWPLLEKANGQKAMYSVFVDRRGL